jgi:hypothetical protein
MSKIYQVRKVIREILTVDGLWHADEVLIKRRTDIWNDVAVACAASARGQCLVIGVAKGRSLTKTQGGKRLRIELTIPVTLLETPNVDPEVDESDPEVDEDTRWEAMVMRLQESPLGRSALHYSLQLEDFEDVEDDDYVIRQAVFKTTILLYGPTPMADS